MCVIMKYTLDSGFPKEETLKSAEMLNKDGGGIAWIDNGKVKWEKGMHITRGYIMDLIEQEKMQLPIIVHLELPHMELLIHHYVIHLQLVKA